MLMNNELLIREVRPEDAARLAEIYSWYVLNTAVSFEYTVPSVEEFEARIRKTTEKYPYLVCMKENKIIGYAYAGAYSPREAYSWTAAGREQVPCCTKSWRKNSAAGESSTSWPGWLIVKRRMNTFPMTAFIFIRKWDTARLPA